MICLFACVFSSCSVLSSLSHTKVLLPQAAQDYVHRSSQECSWVELFHLDLLWLSLLHFCATAGDNEMRGRVEVRIGTKPYTTKFIQHLISTPQPLIRVKPWKLSLCFCVYTAWMCVCNRPAHSLPGPGMVREVGLWTAIDKDAQWWEPHATCR